MECNSMNTILTLTPHLQTKNAQTAHFVRSMIDHDTSEGLDQGKLKAFSVLPLVLNLFLIESRVHL